MRILKKINLYNLLKILVLLVLVPTKLLITIILKAQKKVTIATSKINNQLLRLLKLLCK